MTSPFLLTVAKVGLVILLAGFVAVALARLLLRIVTVQGSSMSPTLLEGTRVLVLRCWPLRRLQRGHIVLSEVADALAMPPRLRRHLDGMPYIKRVAGLPDDTLIIHISELPEKWRTRERPKYDHQGYRTWHIPADHYFLRGDGISSDSLIWGPIPMRAFRGLMIGQLPRRRETTAFMSDTETQ